MLQKFFDYLRPADIIGAFVIVGGFVLLYKGINGVVSGAVIAVVTYYFVNAKNRDYKKPDKPN
jgi:hypothetical protein